MPLRRPRLLACVASAAVALIPAAGSVAAAPPAAAATCSSGISGPNDPDFAAAERHPNSSTTWNSEQWYLYDCLPQTAPAATDPEGAAGMSVNKAWQHYGYGSNQVVVAYMEGGVNWAMTDSRDLRRQAYLNTGELPYPENADGKTAPQLGMTGNPYDLDGDGTVTVDDYKDDPRIPRPFLHEKTAGGITSEDLIAAFSDGIDSDGNGYVDDISGWNFHRDTNDPQTDNSVYHHADGESEQMVAEANNNFGGAGVCPGCRLLSVKMGDEAIDRPDRVAEAIAYAVDAGAKVIDVTSASLGETPSMQAAVDYAYNHGAVIAWASNDFESADHTEGMRLAHVWPGNSVVSDQSNRSRASRPNDLAATTFRSRSSLTSYGAHALFSVPNNDGSTSAGIPTTAGVAAMVQSASVDAYAKGEIASPLSANEVFQVVRATASPIDNQPCVTCFPGEPGAEFNIQYGYGRPNVYAAMKAVHDGQIPPTADVTSPYWYDEVDPTQQNTVQVTANVGAPRASSYDWRIQYALGPQPLDSDFHTIGSGHASGGVQPVSATLDLSQIPSSFWSGDYTAPTPDRLSIERYDVTVRVVATDDRGLVGKDRRVFQLRHDSDEVAALHHNLHTSLESSPTLADIEGNGTLDTIVAGSDGTVWAFRPDGSVAPGWPVQTQLSHGVDPSFAGNYLGAPAWRSGEIPAPHEPITAPLAVGDLDHDGQLWVVASSDDGRVYAWNGAGQLRSGFPIETPRVAKQPVPVPLTPYTRNASDGSVGGVALADLEGTGKLDLVMGGWDGHVYAWRPDGSYVPGWPVSTDTPDYRNGTKPPGADIYARDYKVCTTPTIVDVDGDGHPDVVVALQDTAFGSQGAPVWGYVTGWTSTGKPLPNLPVNVPAAEQGYGTAQDFITEGVQTPVAYTDPVTGNAHLVANAGLWTSFDIDLASGRLDRQETPAELPADGPVDPPSPLVHFTTTASLGKIGASPAITAVQSGSAGVDVITGVTQMPGLGVRVRSGIAAWQPQSGASLPAYTNEIQGLAFLSAPALADISGDGLPDIVLPADSGAMHGWDGVTGRPLAGWPKWTGGWNLFTPAVGDIDGDGKVEVVTGTREGWLHVWRTPGLASGDTEAWHWHQNDRNTGHYGDDTRPPAAITDLTVTPGATTDKLTFTAPGDDWNTGTAASYQVLRSSAPISQQTARLAVRVPLAVPVAPAPAGTKVTLLVPHGSGRYAVRAVDDAGNIGPLPVRLGGGSAGGGSSFQLPVLPAPGMPATAALLALAVAVAARRRDRRQRIA